MGRYGRDGNRSAKYDRNPEFVSHMLEDLGGGLGVTDAVSGPALDEVQLELAQAVAIPRQHLQPQPDHDPPCVGRKLPLR